LLRSSSCAAWALTERQAVEAEQAPCRLGARCRFPIGGAPVASPVATTTPSWPGRLLQRTADAVVERCPGDESSSSISTRAARSRRTSASAARAALAMAGLATTGFVVLSEHPARRVLPGAPFRHRERAVSSRGVPAIFVADAERRGRPTGLRFTGEAVAAAWCALWTVRDGPAVGVVLSVRPAGWGSWGAGAISTLG